MFIDLVAAYLIPIVLGIVFLIALFIILGFIQRLGREPEPSDDPAAKALRRRRKPD